MEKTSAYSSGDKAVVTRHELRVHLAVKMDVLCAIFFFGWIIKVFYTSVNVKMIALDMDADFYMKRTVPV